MSKSGGESQHSPDLVLRRLYMRRRPQDFANKAAFFMGLMAVLAMAYFVARLVYSVYAEGKSFSELLHPGTPLFFCILILGTAALLLLTCSALVERHWRKQEAEGKGKAPECLRSHFVEMYDEQKASGDCLITVSRTHHRSSLMDFGGAVHFAVGLAFVILSACLPQGSISPSLLTLEGMQSAGPLVQAWVACAAVLLVCLVVSAFKGGFLSSSDTRQGLYMMQMENPQDVASRACMGELKTVVREYGKGNLEIYNVNVSSCGRTFVPSAPPVQQQATHQQKVLQQQQTSTSGGVDVSAASRK